MSDGAGGKSREGLGPAGGHPSHSPLHYNYYGTFQGVANYQPQPPAPYHSVIGFPQPVPPPGFCGSLPSYYSHGYRMVPGYVVAEGQPYIQDRLPCCGVGIGWFLFISGFFLGGFTWYIGAALLLCSCLDYREKPGLMACSIAAIFVMVMLLLFA